MQCTALWAQEFFCGHWCRVMDGQVAALKSICKYQTSKTSHSIQIFKMRMHISGLHLEFMTGGLPVNQLPWKRSEQSDVFRKSIGSFVGCFRKCPPASAGEKWLCRFPEQMSPIQKPPKGRDSAANKIFCHVGTSAAASNSIFKPFQKNWIYSLNRD